jgi:hypothetical protein
MNSRRPLALAAAVLALCASYPLAAWAIPHANAPVTDDSRNTLLPTGTLVRVALKNTVSSAHSKSGDKFSFTIVDDVRIGDRIAIPSGTEGTGAVVKSAPAHGGRVDGRLKLQFDPVKLADGTTVALDITQESLVADRNEHNGAAGSLAQVADMTVPGFFLIDFLRKGDDITLAGGAPFHIAVTQDAFLPAPDPK